MSNVASPRSQQYSQAAPPAAAAPPPQAPSDTQNQTVRVMIEENDAIPPTGLFLSHNGRSFMLLPGVPLDLPRFLLEILDHAIESVPQVDPQTKQVIGYRDKLRYPYRRLRRDS